MTNEKNVTILLTIPKNYRDCLRKLAAEENLKNPDVVISGSQLAKEFLCRYMDEHFKDITETGMETEI